MITRSRRLASRPVSRLGEIDVPASEPDERSFEDALFREAFAACFGKLSPDVQALLQQRFAEGLDLASMAAKLGGSVPSMSKRIKAALVPLRRCIHRNYPGA